jgi:ADP-ribose pyrophosphatase YjhB (NUDIX family)
MKVQANYSEHPKFHVAVDCVIFGYENDELKLLLYPRRFTPSKGDWSLMGGFVQEDETMELAARRVLKQTVGLENIYLDNVRGFSEPARDPGGRVISMAYYALIRIDELDSELAKLHSGKWWPLSQLPELVFDHNQMVKEALGKLQQTASYKLIGKELLPEQFTLTQLHNLYNLFFSACSMP